MAEATVYRWKAQGLIDGGEKPGRASVERGELAAASVICYKLEVIEQVSDALVGAGERVGAANRRLPRRPAPPLAPGRPRRADAASLDLIVHLQQRSKARKAIIGPPTQPRRCFIVSAMDIQSITHQHIPV